MMTHFMLRSQLNKVQLKLPQENPGSSGRPDSVLPRCYPSCFDPALETGCVEVPPRTAGEYTGCPLLAEVS